MKLKQFVIVAAKLAVSLGIIWILLGKIDPDRAMNILAGISWSWMALAAFLLVIQIAVHIEIWKSVTGMMTFDLPNASLGRILMISLFFNQALPASLGGAGARVAFSWKAGTPLVKATSAVLFERLIFLYVLLGFAVLSVPFFPATESEQATFIYKSYVAFICLVMIAGTGAAAIALWWRGIWRRWPVVARLSGLLDEMAAAFRTDRRGQLFRSAAWMAAYHVISFLSVMSIFESTGSGHGSWAVAVFLPHVFLAAALPVSINGWGVREVTMVGLLSFAGVPGETAFVISVSFGLCILVSRLPLGVLWFLPERKAEERPK